MRGFYFILLITLASLVPVEKTFGQIYGKVWETYGVSTRKVAAGDQIKIKAYDSRNNLIASSGIDASGSYQLDVQPDKQVRLEFSGAISPLIPAAGYSLVHFVTAPAEVSLALYDPARFVGETPRAIQVVYGQGGVGSKSIDSVFSLIAYPANYNDTIQYSSIASFKSTGSIWGVAYDRVQRRLFSSAIAKRFSGFGSLGAGGIYVTSTGTNQTKPFISLDALGFSTIPAGFERILKIEPGVADHDSLMFSQVGKIGLGGIDVSDDGRFLYTINLYDRKLYRIKLGEDGKVPTAGDITVFPIPLEKYEGGNARPFAVKYYSGQVYVGVVCDAQISQNPNDLRGYVYAIAADDQKAENAVFKEVARFSLNYPRGVIDYRVKGWFPWTDDYLKTLVPNHSGWMIYPQPILADIEFDTDGSLIVSLMDRLGHQSGDGQLYRPDSESSFRTARGISGGDVLRLGKIKKIFQTEQNGQTGTRISLGQNNGEGPGGGEFYTDDSFAASGITWHQETASGGIALLPEVNRLLVSVREPDRYTTGGVKWFDNDNGKSLGALSIFPGGMKRGYFWKSNNVGDIDLITPLPATEIGDRVWIDNNGDGIQDAEEPVLAGVELELYRNDQLIGKAVSDQFGRYVFNDDNVSEKIKSRTDYEVRVPLKQAKIELQPTLIKSGISAELDNDASVNNEYAHIVFKTTNPGENMHDLDFGFQCYDKPAVKAFVKCADNKLYVSLTDFKEGQSYQISRALDYGGITSYTSAKQINGNGVVVEDDLVPGEAYKASMRVFSESGCFQDLFITSENNPGCDYVTDDNDLIKSYSISVFPNPSSAAFNLNYRGGASDGNITILIADQKGRVIQTDPGQLQSGYFRQTYNLSGYPPGTYLLTVKDGTKQTSKHLFKN